MLHFAKLGHTERADVLEPRCLSGLILFRVLLAYDHAAADHLTPGVNVALVAACPTTDPVVRVAVVRVDQFVALAAADEVSVGPMFVGAPLVTATLEVYLVV
jgi:hypothetical protein